MPRTVQFVPDGKRTHAVPADVARLWCAATTRVPAQYAVGTAQHESDFTTNEIDTEESGFQSFGIFQLSREEAREAKLPGANLYSLGESCQVLAYVAGQRLTAILLAAGLREDDPLPPDVWAYLAMAHNAGLAEAEKTIRTHGLDWEAFKKRNANSDWGQKIASYGDDCISGGARWNEVGQGD